MLRSWRNGMYQQTLPSNKDSLQMILKGTCLSLITIVRKQKPVESLQTMSLT
jgi:hypothetical protein